MASNYFHSWVVVAVAAAEAALKHCQCCAVCLHSASLPREHCGPYVPRTRTAEGINNLGKNQLSLASLHSCHSPKACRCPAVVLANGAVCFSHTCASPWSQGCFENGLAWTQCCISITFETTGDFKTSTYCKWFHLCYTLLKHVIGADLYDLCTTVPQTFLTFKESTCSCSEKAQSL